MTEKRTITVKTPTREVSFQMLLGSDSISDAAANYYITNGGVCEPEVCHLMARVVREGDTVVDGGANIGFFTLLLSGLVGPSGKVLAFEPAPQNLAKLRENIKINNAQNVTVDARALWSRDETVQLWMGMDSGISSLSQSAHHLSSTLVAAVRLEHCFDTCRLLKLDVEGAEWHALRGAWDKLSPDKCPYVVCELNTVALDRFGNTIADIRQHMHQRGYSMFLLHRDGGLPSYVHGKIKLTSAKPNLNVLFSTIDQVIDAWPEIHFADDTVDI